MRFFPLALASLMWSIPVTIKAQPLGKPSAVQSPKVTAWKAGGLVFRIPDGWHPQPQVVSPKKVVVFSRNGSTITVYVYPKSQIHLNNVDSRRPRYYASRYAQAWNLPLKQWKTTGATRVYETQEKLKQTIYVVSASSSLAEAEIVAYIRQPELVGATRQAILSLLKGVEAQGSKKVFFTGLPNLALHLQSSTIPHLKRVPMVETFGRYAIRMPKGWWVDDLALPYNTGLEMRSHPELQLTLYNMTNNREYRDTLYLKWMGIRDGKSFNLTKHKRESHQKQLIQKGLSGSKWLSVPGLLVTPVRANGATFVYVSKNLVFWAHVSQYNQSNAARYEAAVIDIVKQLSRQA